MMKIKWLLTFLAVLAVSCGSADTKDESKSLIEKKIEIIKEDNKNKDVAVLIEMIKLKEEHGEAMKPFVEKQFNKIIGENKNHKLDKFIKSPNRELKIPNNVSQIHLRNNYPGGNTAIVIKKDNKFIAIEPFMFNNEYKSDITPGNYDIYMIIDRNFNDNIFIFSSKSNFKGGELYLGEFTINSQLNKSGSCKAGEIPDTDMCIKPFFKILDNCPPGQNLVEHLCCEEGFNFIMNGKCSRYSDTVESVQCPAGYHEAGKGRCCPNGTALINDRCQETPEASEEE